MSDFNIMTNDPSLTAWGYAILNNRSQVLKVGCLRTEPRAKKLRIRVGDDNVRRISELNINLIELIETHNVRYLLAELPHGSQMAKGAQMIGMVTGILQAIADCKRLGIEWYSEGDAKTCLLGRRSVTKSQTIDAIEQHYTIPWTRYKYANEAIADAMAVYHVATTQSSVLRFINNKK